MTGAIKVKTNPANPGDDLEVTISDIHAEIESTSSGVPCFFEADGTPEGVITPGPVGSPANDAILTLNSAKFAGAGSIVDTGFDLVISAVSGCASDFQQGDILGAVGASRFRPIQRDNTRFGA